MGTALLLAAAPAGRGRAIDAASVLPALAAVQAGVLAGTDMATVVELADPLDPQTVLTRLRSAAASPGPLALYLAGQLQLDRRQQLPHLALARSTPTTLRYTGLPWHWLAAELAARRPGTTTVVADLAADPALWQRLAADRNVLSLGQAVPLYARITPFPRRGDLFAPDYLRHFATLWRTGARPPLPTLHAEAAAAAAAASETESLLLTPSIPADAAATPGPLPQPFGAVAPVDSPPTRRLGRAGLAHRAASLGAQRAGAAGGTASVTATPVRPAGAVEAPTGAEAMPRSVAAAASAVMDPHDDWKPSAVPAPVAESARVSPSPVQDTPTGDVFTDIAALGAAPADGTSTEGRQGTADVPESPPTSAGRETGDEGARRPTEEPPASAAPVGEGSVAESEPVPVPVPVPESVPAGAPAEPEPVPAAAPAESESVPAAAPAEPEPDSESRPEPGPGPAAEAGPEPAPEPRGASTPEGAPERIAAPAPSARPEQHVDPQPTAEPRLQSEPASEPQPQPQPTAVPQPQPQSEPRAQPEPHAPSDPHEGPAASPERAAGMPQYGPAADDEPKPTPARVPGPALVTPSPAVRVPPRPAYAPGSAAVPEGPRRPVPGAGSDGPPRPGSEADPHPAILAAAMAGRHGEAAAMAAAWESDALRRYGPRSGEALHWVEVRADLARLAGEPARSCELWIAAAQARLGLRQGPDEPDVEGAVDRAHHQWEQIRDPARARALGPALVELRRAVPGRRAGALAALQKRLAQ